MGRTEVDMMVASTERRRVVLIDDEPMVLAAIASFLALETDCCVTSFCCPEEALAHLGEQGADVVVVDLSIRGMNAPAFIERVKCLDSSIRLLLLSGAIDESWRDDMVRCGLDGCLEKPWCNDELRTQIMTRAQKPQREDTD